MSDLRHVYNLQNFTNDFTKSVIELLHSESLSLKNCSSFHVCKFENNETKVIQGSTYYCMIILRGESKTYEKFFDHLVKNYLDGTGLPSPIYCLHRIITHSIEIGWITPIKNRNMIFNPFVQKSTRKTNSFIKNSNFKTEKSFYQLSTIYENEGYDETLPDYGCTKIINHGPCRGEICGKKPINSDGKCLKCSRCVYVVNLEKVD